MTLKKKKTFFIVVVFQPVNHNIFTLDLQYTEEDSYPLTRRVDLMKLFENHRPQKSQNVALDNSKVIANNTTKETLSVSPSKKEMDVDSQLWFLWDIMTMKKMNGLNCCLDL